MPLTLKTLANIPLSDMPLEILAFVAGAFFIAGIVKGLTGLGLPAMSLGLLLLALELRDAMAILVIPLFATNIWQGVTGGHVRAMLTRLWPLFATGVIGIWFAVGVMVTTNPAILAIMLGIILAGYAAYSLSTPQIKPPGRWEIILSPLAGAITGIMRAVFLFSTSYCRSRMFECVVLSLFHRRRGRLKVQRIDEGVHRTVIFFRNGPLQVRRPLEK